MRAVARGDDGLAATAIILTVVVGVLALLFVYVIPLLAATDKVGQTQTAADAAALAGAVGARDRAVDEIDDAVWDLRIAALFGTRETWRFSGAAAGGSGRLGAEQYAARNDASVESYHHDAARDRVAVDVRLDARGPENRIVRSSGTAQVGVELASCEIVAERTIIGYTQPPPPTPTPTPTPTPSTTPSPTPTPPPFVPQPIYSAWEYRISCAGEHGFSDSDSRIDQLVDRAAARLGDLEPILVR
ncbi:hypothetical protein ASG23_09590 [Cellulomonas sp. Leaf395]|nr:hypothetical protein ASG23_09590 [Cellulomonas sp. Leaf395]